MHTQTDLRAKVTQADSCKNHGFFRRHSVGLLQIALSAMIFGVAYIGFAATTGNLILNNSEIYEHHNPTAAEQQAQSRKQDNKKYPSVVKSMSTTMEATAPWAVAITRAAEAPWKMMGYVTPDTYREARAKALQIAGIDENNSSHDKQRFEFYRQLGFAVIRTEDGRRGIYIPFIAWREYIKQNTSFRNPEWDQLKDLTSKPSEKYRGFLRGKVFFKADSKAQGGNEDGIVDDLEWNRALEAMGYTPVESIVDQIIEKAKANSPELKAELGQTIRTMLKSEKVADLDTRIPITTLEAYLR